MNQFKCRHCDLSAHFYFREGGMLCVDHAEAFCLAQVRLMLERSTLDNSTSFSSLNSFSGIGSARETSAMLHPEVVDGSTATLQVGTAVTAGETAPKSACCSLDSGCDSPSSDAPVGLSGVPTQERPLTSFNRSSTTTFRVAASSLIHESSDIPNHHQ